MSFQQYETALGGDSSSGLQQLAYHTVNRRYREFLNLQTRLEEKPDLRKFIKSQAACLRFTSDHPDLDSGMDCPVVSRGGRGEGRVGVLCFQSLVGF